MSKPKFVDTTSTTANLIGNVTKCLKEHDPSKAIEFKGRVKKIKNWEELKILINEYVEVIKDGE